MSSVTLNAGKVRTNMIKTGMSIAQLRAKAKLNKTTWNRGMTGKPIQILSAHKIIKTIEKALGNDIRKIDLNDYLDSDGQQRSS